MIRLHVKRIADHFVIFIGILTVLTNVFVFLNTETYNHSDIFRYNDRMAYETDLGGDYCQNIKEPVGGLVVYGVMFPFGFFMIRVLAIFIASMQASEFFRQYKKRKKISIRLSLFLIAAMFLVWISSLGVLYVAISALFLAVLIFYKYDVFTYRKEELAIGIVLMVLSWIILLGAWMSVSPAFYYCADNANPFFW